MKHIILMGTAVGLLLLVVFVVFRTPLFLADISPAAPGKVADPRRVAASIDGYHGRSLDWYRLDRVTLKLKGAAYVLPARIGLGIPAGEVEVDLTFWPGQYGRYRYRIKSQAEESRGIVDENTPRRQRLLMNSLRFLFELPFTAFKTPMKESMAPADWQGKTFERFIASWNTLEPQMNIDQKIFWVLPPGEEQAGRLLRVDTTGRDIAPFITARIELIGEKTISGFKLPAHVKILGLEPESDLVHEWKLLGVEIHE